MVKKEKTVTEEVSRDKRRRVVVFPDDECASTNDIRHADYYHGMLTRTDMNDLLKKEGDFIVRKTEYEPGMLVLVLDVRHEGLIRHFMFNYDEGHFYISTHRSRSISELIAYYMKGNSLLASSASTPVKLIKAVSRPSWLLNHDQIKLFKKLGEGAFGEVYLAEFSSGSEKTEVAVKTVREEVARDARLKFMKEARLMRRFKHKHVVHIIGVALHEHPLMLLMELCPGGSLLSYLRKHRGVIEKSTKHRFMAEAADGLAFLELQKCIHRDVAARNCLLSAKLELKVGDFGMSDEKTMVVDDKLDKVPIKWLAPETMQKKVYSTKSDVWSYGILAWEIWAEGVEPYPGITNLQARARIIVQDYRMEMPKETPSAISKLVSQCWDKTPEKRPGFVEILSMLKNIKV